MFAAIGVSLSYGAPVTDALRLAVAAGSLNATRRGLGSGHATEIMRVVEHVDVRPLSSSG